MAISRVVSELFDFENVVTLKSGSGGHSRSLKAVQCDRLGMISY